MADALWGAGAHRVTVNVADADVEPAAALRMPGPESPVALVSVWVDSATDHLRAPVDAVIAAVGLPWSAYLVTESIPMVNTRFPAAVGERVHGLAQVAFLQRPQGQSVEEWLDIWLNSHTFVAVDLQDTFSYVQNVVARVLTPGAEPWHAIVEECFPAAAMTDPHVFFDAVGDDERLARHQTEMFESVQRFIDLAKIAVLPTSRYDV
ncbi:EthD domain-containing protein [Aquihabitans sp. McL0605]|uniref:EthD domain-containing protein n=1 Tax=Aquihabitans sp. McL0605 TaxID=3415671 RepID=UPI003CF0BBAA